MFKIHTTLRKMAILNCDDFIRHWESFWPIIPLFHVGMLETDPKGFFTDQCFGIKFRFSTMRDYVILVQTICKQAVKSPTGLRTTVLKFGITAVAILVFWCWSDSIWEEGSSWGGYWLYLMRTEDTQWQWPINNKVATPYSIPCLIIYFGFLE